MENQNMEDSSSRPNVSKSEQDNPRSAASNQAGANSSFSPESIADSLTSALENGDLDRLAKSRRAFQSERQTASRTADEWTLPDLETMLERRNAQRAIDEAVISTDDLHKEEESLRQAQEELERRRHEVEAAKRRAEDEAKRKAAESQRRAIEAETQRRAREHGERLAELEAIRKAAETAALQAARKEQTVNGEIDALRQTEEKQLKQIAEAESRLREQVAACDAVEV